MITDKCADYVTTSFKNRWRALMSVDDIIEEVVSFIEENEGLAKNTYLIYSVIDAHAARTCTFVWPQHVRSLSVESKSLVGIDSLIAGVNFTHGCTF